MNQTAENINDDGIEIEADSFVYTQLSHPEAFAGHSELAEEPVVALTYEPLSLVERAVIEVHKHHRRIKGLGGLALGGLGFAAGAIAFSPRH